jgi:RNA polymerase sigma factor (sigma-70 family)
MIGNNEEAEQLTQQTFAGFYSYLLSNPNLHHAKPLLFRIATNASLNYICKDRKNKEILKKMPLTETACDNPLDKTIMSQRRSIIQRGLVRLKTRDRECILLYTEGFSYTEIANIVGTKKATIGKILFRAIERLALQINKGVRQ